MIDWLFCPRCDKELIPDYSESDFITRNQTPIHRTYICHYCKISHIYNPKLNRLIGTNQQDELICPNCDRKVPNKDHLYKHGCKWCIGGCCDK